MTKKVKEHIGFHYLLTEIQLYTLIFFGIEYIHEEVLTEIKNKSIIHNIFRIQDNESIMCGLYCTSFHRIYTWRKNWWNKKLSFRRNDLMSEKWKV